MPTKPTTGEFIDLSYARQLALNYVEGKLQPGTIKTDDTRAVWFSKDALLSLLGAEAGPGTEEISGVRIYFGAYKDEPGYPANEVDRDKLTLVLVATGMASIEVTRGTETELAYLDIIEGDNKTSPAYPDPANPPTTQKYMNEGQMCPPPPSASGLGLMDW